MQSVARRSRAVAQVEPWIGNFYTPPFFALPRSHIANLSHCSKLSTPIELFVNAVPFGPLPFFARDDPFFSSPTPTVCDHFAHAHEPLCAYHVAQHCQRYFLFAQQLRRIERKLLAFDSARARVFHSPVEPPDFPGSYHLAHTYPLRHSSSTQEWLGDPHGPHVCSAIGT